MVTCTCFSQATCFEWWRCLKGASQGFAVMMLVAWACPVLSRVSTTIRYCCCRVDALRLAAAAPSNQGPASYLQVQQLLHAHCTKELQTSLLGAVAP